MARYALEVMYDGTQVHGSQIQGTTPTVQLAVNTALSTLLRTNIDTFGASRTDEGVHALCNLYHFDLELAPNPDFVYKLNAVLPMSVAVNKFYQAVNPEFNCRFDAIRRRYRYKIYFKKNPFQQERALYHPYKFNMDLLNETAEIIKEYTQFESFSKRNAQSKTFNCTIHQSYWENHGDELHYVVEGNRFLRGMVRGLVGTQLKLASKQGTSADFRAIIEAQNCTLANFNVTGNGLYLEEIAYPEGLLVEIK